MATKKTASKTSSRAQLDLDYNEKQAKKTGKKVGKTIKKLKPVSILLAVLLLLAGVCGGWFAFGFVTRNDCFELVGTDEQTCFVGEKYFDEGVKIVAFGKDVSQDIEIETNLVQNDDGSFSSNEEGTFYIVFKSKNIKYNSLFKVQKIRLVNFVEKSDEIVD